MLISMVVDCVHLSQRHLHWHLLLKEVTTSVIRVFLLFAVLVKPLIPIIPYIWLLLHPIRQLLSKVLLIKTRWLWISPLRVPLLLHLLLSLSFSLSSHSFFFDSSKLLNLSFLIAVVLMSLSCCVALWLLGLKVSALRIVRGHHILLLLLFMLHIILATLLLWLLLLL